MIKTFLTLLMSLALPAAAQTAEEVQAAHGRVVPSIRRCWTRGESKAADAAGMPKTVCVDRARADGRKARFDGFAILAGGAQRENLVGEHDIYGAAATSFSIVFHWNAGPKEFDEESVFQLAYQRDENGAIDESTLRPVAFHQCPERGCAYACGVTSVEFTPSADPTAPRPKTSY